MKKQFSLLTLSALFMVALNAQTSNGWSTTDRKEFVTSCIETAKAGMSVDSARHYCTCMLDKVEAMYPNSADAAKISEADFETPAWQKMIMDCLKGQWNTRDRTEFIESCFDKAKASIGEAKARSYCECMLYKVEKAYPNSADAAKLTAEILAQPAWKKKILDCLEQ